MPSFDSKNGLNEAGSPRETPSVYEAAGGFERTRLRDASFMPLRCLNSLGVIGHRHE